MTSYSAGLARFQPWFKEKGWQVYPHQIAMLEAAAHGQSALLIAPTGGGKTLAGFLPSLVDLATYPHEGLHTLYISPLKALTADVERNLLTPIAALKLSITVEVRTGDTSSYRKKRHFIKPPHILLTTPESLELLLSYPDARGVLKQVKRIIVDEVHALAPGKRGHLAALCMAELRSLNPAITVTGLSATVAEPEKLAAWLKPDAKVIHAAEGPLPHVTMLETRGRIPWAGYMATYAVGDIYNAILAAKSAIVFVNTRAQAEWLFQQLWRSNSDDLPIGLHHGSLEKEHRLKVEASMAQGKLRAIVATASLDLGLDWGAVDLVIQVGAPKGISRLLQRIGRSNHRYNKPSEALLVPTNRFETLECVAVMNAITEGARDGEPLYRGSLDVMVQFIMNHACAGPFNPADLWHILRQAPCYSHVSEEDFFSALHCVAHGGYALVAYERFQRISQNADGLWQASPAAIRRHRMNSGTIVEYETIRVGLRRKKSAFLRDLGRIEEFFVQGLVPGDTFLFAGQLLKYLGIREDRVEVEKGKGERPKIPSFNGGRLPLTLPLAARVLALLEDERLWPQLPAATRSWLEAQHDRSELPQKNTLLVETFPHEKKYYAVFYSFAGRNANQTLGLLLTLAMEEEGYLPLGFVASDYALAIWSLRPLDRPEALIHNALADKAIDDWIARSQMAKRAFRDVAIIAGLVERNTAGKRKSGRQVTISTDLIYDVLRRHEPGHVLLKATREDVANRIADTVRLKEQILPLAVRHTGLDKPSPLAIPLLLDVGAEKIKDGKGEQALLSIHDIERQRNSEGDALFRQSGAA